MSEIRLSIVEDGLELISIIGMGNGKEEALDDMAWQIIDMHNLYCFLPLKKTTGIATRLKLIVEAIDREYKERL